ncbi:N-acetylmuramoyl-L-alanine amidase family protein [Haloferula rosea]|uniref:N-acetylmuramoyl-L-alanine amidase n=1 Tax=Haloferula rosea TaxID=490093 RepID=A0A934VEF2_9BACT|nr:N-acetylmuramoyl-L-alanine amidase [Haloferula rosea]MBK1825902.1 N-acetylmuramoyl-L-alanine amidase [Haloferula rosea]
MKCVLWLALGWLGLAGMAEAARFSTVVIDPGHGGKDKGAYWGGVRESTLNLKVATKLEALLKKRGIRTVMTRRSNVFVSLQSRVAMANRYRSAVFVSIHFNASTNTTIKGAETYYWGTTGRMIAGAIQRRLPARVVTRNRGARRHGFTVLTQTRCPAVLVECGFISNSRERARCSTDWYQETAARAIYDGLMACR